MLLGLIINLYITKIIDLIITLSLNKEVGRNIYGSNILTKAAALKLWFLFYTISIPFLVDNATLH
jgi:hypothetical protein